MKATGRRCAHLGAAISLELDATAEQIRRAQELLAAAMKHLRESFAAMASVPSTSEGHAQHRLQLEEAVIALQSEDAVGQVLDNVRVRTVRLRGLVEGLGPVALALAAQDGAERAPEAGLREALLTLKQMRKTPPSVSQRRVAAGTVDIF
jgi:hypothetical protein